MKKLIGLALGFLLFNCYAPERNCEKFHEGKFSFTTTLEGKEQTTTFLRYGNMEISEFIGNTDSASVRWINNCEYILTNLNPKSRSEEKPIHIKILTTTTDSYTFEYKIVGESKSQRGTAKIFK